MYKGSTVKYPLFLSHFNGIEYNFRNVVVASLSWDVLPQSCTGPLQFTPPFRHQNAAWAVLAGTTVLRTYYLPRYCLSKLRTKCSRFSSWKSWRLKIGWIDCPEMSVRYYRHMLRNSPEGRSPQIWKFSKDLSKIHTKFHENPSSGG